MQVNYWLAPKTEETIENFYYVLPTESTYKFDFEIDKELVLMDILDTAGKVFFWSDFRMISKFWKC